MLTDFNQPADSWLAAVVGNFKELLAAGEEPAFTVRFQDAVFELRLHVLPGSYARSAPSRNYAVTCLGTSKTGMITVYGRDTSAQPWEPLGQTLSKSEAIDLAMRLGLFFDERTNPDHEG